MKKLLLIIGSIICLNAFAQKKMTPAIKLFEVKPNTAALITDNGENGLYANHVDSSDVLLFEYTYTAAQNDAISDDEYSEILAFNIVPDKTGKFVLKGDALKSAQAYFYKGCFCKERGYFTIVGGTIKGTKISGTTWSVDLNVQVKGKLNEGEKPFTKKLKGKFTILSKK